MSDLNRSRKWAAARCAALVMISAGAGCARLQIGVDTYTGELLMPDDAKLAKGVAFAGQIHELVRREESQLSKVYPANPSESEARVLYFDHLVDLFNDEKIEQKWKDYVGAEARWTVAVNQSTDTGFNINQNTGVKITTSSKTSSASLTADRDEKRQSLESSLLRYGNACILAGQDLGIVPAIVARIKADLLLPVPLLDLYEVITETQNPEAVMGVALEESGRRLVDLSADLEDTSQRATLSHLMAASSQGSVIDAATSGLAAKLVGASDILESTNWSRINDIYVDGTGNEEYVIIKDDVGNWHIKSAKSDPSDVANAVFDTTTAMVNVVASHYGVPVSLGTTDSSANTGTGTYSSGEVKSDEAQQVLEQLASARKALQAGLADAANEAAKASTDHTGESPTNMTNSTSADATALANAKAIAQQAADAYKARVNELSFYTGSKTPSTDSGNGSTSTIPANANTGTAAIGTTSPAASATSAK